jgi:hypothetical protein
MSEKGKRERDEWQRTFSKPNCFSSAKETAGWKVSCVTDEEVGVCWVVANDIHLAAFPIAMVCGGGGVLEGSRWTTG